MAMEEDILFITTHSILLHVKFGKKRAAFEITQEKLFLNLSLNPPVLIGKYEHHHTRQPLKTLVMPPSLTSWFTEGYQPPFFYSIFPVLIISLYR